MKAKGGLSKWQNVQFLGTGRRKSSIARVILTAGDGKFTVNNKTLDEFFGFETLRMEAKAPLVLTERTGNYDIKVSVKGGGYTGQAGAIRHRRVSCAYRSRAGAAAAS